MQVFRATTNLGVMFPLREPEEHHPFVRAWHAFMRHRSAHPDARRVPTNGPHRSLAAQISARGRARARHGLPSVNGPGVVRLTMNNEPGEGGEEHSEGAASLSRMDDESHPETLQEQARQAAAAGCVIVGFDVSARRRMSNLSQFNPFFHHCSLREVRARYELYYAMK